MGRRRTLGMGLSLGLVFFGLACNLITGAVDRVVDPTEASDADLQPGDSGTDRPDADGGTILTPIDGASLPDPPDATADVITLPVEGAWMTPNGAAFTHDDAGIAFTGYTGTIYHPVVLPITQPPIDSDDYTIIATFHATTVGEFGLLGRIQPGGSATLFGSEYGASTATWIGTIGPSDWSPSTPLAQGLHYDFVNDARYHFKLRFSGTTTYGKMWINAAAEPAEWVKASSYATGRGVGFYTYCYPSVPDAVLESISVEVP